MAWIYRSPVHRRNAGIHPPYGDRRARIAHRGDDKGVRVPLPANNAYAMSTTSIASIREEIASALTHGLGAVFALAASAVLITLAAIYGDGWQLASAIVFGIALLLLYTASTLYHAIQHPVAKGRLKVFDHCAIYLLIAGSYTPFCLVTLHGPWGWTLFGIVWGLAVIGILQEIKPRSEARILSIVIYAVMGWIVLVAVKPLIAALGMDGFIWLASGGVLYTVGIIFFALEHRLRHSHGIWHLFVIGGSLLHFVAIMRYVL